MGKLKCVVMGGKVFNVEVLGENLSIKDGFYVRYECGGTDTFRAKFLLERPQAQPTIADYLEDNKPMLTKTKAKMVTLESLKEFAGIEN